MGIDMSKLGKFHGQQACQGGHMLMHLKMDVVTNEGGHTALSLRCSVCDNICTFNVASNVSESGTTKQAIVTELAQAEERDIVDNFAEFTQKAIKTDMTCDHCDNNIDLVMQVESHESHEAGMNHENQVDHHEREVFPREAHSYDHGHVSVQRTDHISKSGTPLVVAKHHSDKGKQDHQSRTKSSERLKRKQACADDGTLFNKITKLQVDTAPLTGQVKDPPPVPSPAYNTQQHPPAIEHADFDNRVNLNAHTGFIIPNCKFCGRPYVQAEIGQGKIWSHVCPQTDSTVYICSVCNEYYSSWSLVMGCERKHRLAGSAKEEYMCMVCSKTFADLEETKKHEACHMLSDSGESSSFLPQSEIHTNYSSEGPQGTVTDVTSSTPSLDDSQQQLMGFQFMSQYNVDAAFPYTNPDVVHPNTPPSPVPPFPSSLPPMQSLPFLPATNTAAQQTPLNHIPPSRHNQAHNTAPPRFTKPTNQQLFHLKTIASQPSNFCVRLMAHIFTSEERMDAKRNCNGKKGRESLCKSRINYIRETASSLYPFQSKATGFWRKCTSAMDSANRKLRSRNRQQN